MQQQDELIGAMLGNYRILAPLGQGGMARVYKAHQENLDREVAIKVLPPWYAADRSFVERFNLEARLVARLSHPNIVTVHDASEQNGHLYIVMQLVDGGTLKQRLDQLRMQGRPMDIVEVNTIFKQIADALAYAHSEGVIHRDIKPVNVLLDRAGRPILSDFGLAKMLAGTERQLTRPGAGVGTPEYMSPEQCLGGPIDARADIYALGILLYESLTGRTPFIGDNYAVLAHSHIYEPPPPPSRFNPAITPAIERVILTALAKNPARRYQYAGDMARAFDIAVKGISSHPGAYSAESEQNAFQAQAPAPTPPVSPTSPAVQPPMFICPNCQGMNRPEMLYCTRCGNPLNLCPRCGKLNRANNRFCTDCGQGLMSVQV